MPGLAAADADGQAVLRPLKAQHRHPVLHGPDAATFPENRQGELLSGSRAWERWRRRGSVCP